MTGEWSNNYFSNTLFYAFLDYSGSASRSYLEGGVCVGVMIGKVADVVLVAEAGAEGHSEIGFSLLASSCNGAPRKMVSIKEQKHFISKH